MSDRAQAGAIRRMSEGTARYVPYRRPDPGAPNIVIVVLDDIGFAQLGCFGSTIATPHIDRVAAGACGTTCSTSPRSVPRPGALLSGRNHTPWGWA